MEQTKLVKCDRQACTLTLDGGSSCFQAVIHRSTRWPKMNSTESLGTGPSARSGEDLGCPRSSCICCCSRYNIQTCQISRGNASAQQLEERPKSDRKNNSKKTIEHVLHVWPDKYSPPLESEWMVEAIHKPARGRPYLTACRDRGLRLGVWIVSA